MTESPSGSERPTNMWEELNKPKSREGTAATGQDRDNTRGVPFVGFIAGAVAVATVVIAGFIVMGGGSDVTPDEATGDADDELALVEDDESGATDAGDGTDTTDSTDTADSAEPGDDATDAASDDEDVQGDDGDAEAYSPAVPVGADGRYVVLSRGKLYLRGEMPSQAHVDGVVSTLEQLMGEGNVIPEYVIDPETDFEIGQPSDVFIEDTVLFAFASAEIAPDFYPLLGLGVTLMQLQDTVTIEFYGHTDSVGSDETNMALSQARVDAAKAFLVAQGIDPDRITAIGRGETEPVADNDTPEGRQFNRRVEIVITGFVFSL